MYSIVDSNNIFYALFTRNLCCADEFGAWKRRERFVAEAVKKNSSCCQRVFVVPAGPIYDGYISTYRVKWEFAQKKKYNTYINVVWPIAVR